MTSIQMNEPVIKYWLEQLSTNELKGFNALVADILAQRKKVAINEEEALLEKINQTVDKVVLARLATLQEKQSTGTLNEQEYEELLQIIEQIENFDAVRIIHLGQLAKLRNITITELRKQLHIYPKVNGEIIYS